MPRTKKLEGQHSIVNPNSLRNLKQFRDIPEEEWKKKADEIELAVQTDGELDRLIELEYNRYQESYDLSDMMPNDEATLRALILATIRLTKYERELNRIESKGITDANILLTDKISNVCNGLRTQISALQETLKISRKVRRSDKEQNVIEYIDKLKERASLFYEKKMVYLLCPKDNNLLGTIWIQYGESKQNHVSLYCRKCGVPHSFDVYELFANKKVSNLLNQLPEGMR